MGRNSPPTLRGHRGSRDPPRLPSYSGVQQLTAPTHQGQWGLTAPFVQCTAARGARTKLPFWLQVVEAEQPEGAVQLGPTLFPWVQLTPLFIFGKHTDIPQGVSNRLLFACWEKERTLLSQQSKQTCPIHLVFIQRSLIHSPLTTCQLLFNSACLPFYRDSCLSFFWIELRHFPGEICHMTISLT